MYWRRSLVPQCLSCYAYEHKPADWRDPRVVRPYRQKTRSASSFPGGVHILKLGHMLPTTRIHKTRPRFGTHVWMDCVPLKASLLHEARLLQGAGRCTILDVASGLDAKKSGNGQSGLSKSADRLWHEPLAPVAVGQHVANRRCARACALRACRWVAVRPRAAPRCRAGEDHWPTRECTPRRMPRSRLRRNAAARPCIARPSGPECMHRTVCARQPHRAHALRAVPFASAQEAAAPRPLWPNVEPTGAPRTALRGGTPLRLCQVSAQPCAASSSRTILRTSSWVTGCSVIPRYEFRASLIRV